MPDEKDNGEIADGGGGVSEDAERAPRKPRARKPREARIDGGDGEEVDGKSMETRVPREPKRKTEPKPRLELTGEQSQVRTQSL